MFKEYILKQVEKTGQTKLQFEVKDNKFPDESVDVVFPDGTRYRCYGNTLLKY